MMKKIEKIVLIFVVLLLAWLSINEYNRNQKSYINYQDRWVSSE